MKNTVYALAAEHLTGRRRGLRDDPGHPLPGLPQVHRATVGLREHRWTPIAGGGGVSTDSFRRAGDVTRTATVAATADAVAVESGVEDLVVMKTRRSAFAGFPATATRLSARRTTASWPRR